MQSCRRHGYPAARAWEPEAEVTKAPMNGPLGNLIPQGPIFISHDITAQCTVCAPFLVAGGWGTKEKNIPEQRVRFGYGPNVNSKAKPPR